TGQSVPVSVTTPEINFTIPAFVGLLTVTRNGGGGGNGGAVNVTDTGNITTYGVGADGIFAQSIGGAGGLAGTSAASVLAFMGSDGNAGNGGTVTVNHTGSIIATGNDASAIFAQSVGGTQAPDASAAFASFGHVFDSHGDTTPGTGSDITITVSGGTFEGGGDTGAGIWIDNGLVNSITIASSATVEALSGAAIKATEDSGLIVNSVDNFGTVAGDVLLAGTNANSFKNEAGAILAPNSTVDLAGGTLTNLGTLSPGGVGKAATVALNGNLIEATGSTYAVDISSGAADLINVAGNASVAGTIAVHFSTITNAPLTILTTTGTLTNAGATISGNTAVVTFAPSFSANALTLDPTANWDPPAANLDGNQTSLSNYLQSLWNNGSTGFATGMGTLANIASPTAYAGALGQLTGEVRADTAQAAVQSVTPFLDLLMSSAGLDTSSGLAENSLPDGAKPAQLETGVVRAWVAPYGGHINFSADEQTGAQMLSTNLVGVAAGLESHVDDSLLVGGSVAVSGDRFLFAGGQSEGDSTALMLAAYGREALFGQAYVSGAIFYGRYNVATMRAVTISSDDILRGHFVANDFGARLEGGYNFALDDSSALTPYAGLLGQDFKAPAYSETVLSGAPTFALSYSAEENGFVQGDIGARLNHDFEVKNDTFVTEFHAAWIHQLQDDVVSRAGIASVAGSSFVVTGATMPLDSLNLGAGLQLKADRGLGAGVRLESQFGTGFTALSGTINVGYAW
ncbi:MAG: autotransporter domain-containing protein, partial [Rhizomicrobium sp.]